MEHCSGCGKVERRPAARRSAASGRKIRAWRLGAAWLSVAAATLGLLIAVMSAVARGAFSAVVVGTLTGVLYGNIAVGAFRNRKGAFLAGVIVTFFPCALLLVRTLEFVGYLWSGELPEYHGAIRQEAMIFGTFFAFFALHFLTCFFAWVKHAPSPESGSG